MRSDNPSALGLGLDNHRTRSVGQHPSQELGIESRRPVLGEAVGTQGPAHHLGSDGNRYFM